VSTEASVEGFFDNTGGGVGAPSASIKVPGDVVFGEVVDQALVDKKKFASDEIEHDKVTGKPIKQLVVILQTDQRDWHNVAKVPTNEDGSTKAASEDDGRRAIYVAPFTNIHAAIGDAIVAATGEKGPIRNGAKLAVKIVELKDTGKGNPLKVHAAKYEPPVASGGEFFGDSNTVGETTTGSTAQPAAAQTTPPAAEAAPSAPVQQDPWGAPATGAGPLF
jgi:hypothetical protein